MRWFLTGCLLLLVSAAAYLFWPQTRHLAPAPPPPVTAKQYVAAAPLSRIFVTVFVPRERLVAELEAATPKTHKGEKLDPIDGPVKNDRLRWQATRSAIRVDTSAGNVEAMTTLKGMVRINGRLVGLPVAAQADLGARITVSASPILRHDWRIDPNLTAAVDVTKARIPIKKIGSVSVKRLLLKELHGKIAELERDLNKNISENQFIEDAARRVMTRICGLHDFEASDGQPGWLRVSPEVWEAAQPFVYEDGILVGLGLTARMDIAVGPRPVEPDCSFGGPLELLDAMPEPVVSLSATGQVSWDDLSQYATQKLAGGAINGDAGGQTIAVQPTKVTLSPYGSGILVSMDFEGALGGWLGSKLAGSIHFLARPVLDPQREELRLDDVTLWVDSAQAMSATGPVGKVAGPFLEDLVASKARIDLGEAAAKARASVTRAQGQLNARALLNDGYRLEGGIDHIELSDVVVSEAALLLRLTAKGALRVVAD